MINPLIISDALKIREFLKKHPIEITGIHHEIKEAKDGSGWVANFQFKFPMSKKGKEQAEIFMKMYNLAELMDLTQI